jgi:hypothetical protein
MLVESGLVEQRNQAVLGVFDGAVVSDMADRFGVAPSDGAPVAGRYAPAGWPGSPPS